MEIQDIKTKRTRLNPYHSLTVYDYITYSLLYREYSMYILHVQYTVHCPNTSDVFIV
jgi:hypothetical protein